MKDDSGGIVVCTGPFPTYSSRNELEAGGCTSVLHNGYLGISTAMVSPGKSNPQAGTGIGVSET